MKVVLGVEYDGGAYAGWQYQPHAPSVQNELQKALGKVADEPITVHAAGRTDAGVHALCQVVHFETAAQRDEKAWTMGVNRHLPHDIAVVWSCAGKEDFHARFSATARRYVYLLHTGPVRSALNGRRAAWCKRKLDASLMHQAAQQLIGEHDFSAFRASECQSNTPMRNMQRIVVSGDSGLIRFDITANAFLHHMVRNIVGVLIKVGSGERPVDWVAAVLAGRDRREAGVTAQPQGLYLASVTYPEHFGLPPASATVAAGSGSDPDSSLAEILGVR